MTNQYGIDVSDHYIMTSRTLSAHLTTNMPMMRAGPCSPPRHPIATKPFTVVDRRLTQSASISPPDCPIDDKPVAKTSTYVIRRRMMHAGSCSPPRYEIATKPYPINVSFQCFIFNMLIQYKLFSIREETVRCS